MNNDIVWPDNVENKKIEVKIVCIHKMCTQCGGCGVTKEGVKCKHYVKCKCDKCSLRSK